LILLRLFCQEQDIIFFVHEAPPDQDLGLEDYITKLYPVWSKKLAPTSRPNCCVYVKRLTKYDIVEKL